jgi:GNAT superfamily N-acetyltransferase
VTDPSIAASLTVRRIAREDAEAVCELSGQLGYETGIGKIEEQIDRLASSDGDEVAFVACVGDEAVGWIEAAVIYHLQSAPYVLISGLVVKDGMRGLGVGRRLCAEVETWTSRKGVRVLRVTSRMTRERAHQFYLSGGFRQTKISAVFEKVVREEALTDPQG